MTVSGIEKCVKYIVNPNYRFLINSYFFGYKKMSDERFLKKKFKIVMGKDLDLDDPKSFNEKLQWLKLYDRNPNYTRMVDKYDVKEYVSSIIGEEHIIPTIGVWENYDDIDFKLLPNQFVLKCTHDSGGLVICKDKQRFDCKKAKRKISNSLKRQYFYSSREWPYKDVKPRIIAETYITDGTDDLKDYKLMCFNGKVKCSFVCSGRGTKEGLHVTFFDEDWNVMSFERKYPRVEKGFPKPDTYEKMKEFAEKLSRNIPFVRVDFYDVNGHIYFGELTFYPGTGLEAFEPSYWDDILGSWLVLPEKTSED